MEIGLKSFLPKLAGRLQTTPGSLYEYQRRLVALGVVRQRKGKGPGTGVRLTAENLAALILSQMFTENPSLVDERVKWLCKSTPMEKCAFTGAATLREAVARILLMPGIERRPFHRLVVYRDQLESTLYFQTAPSSIAKTFFEAGRNLAEYTPISTIRELRHTPLFDIAGDFQSEVGA
ncbi:hypothetical protein [Bradyrhizobium sp. AZCC 1721]|uniref:hypothetical protein n=1 Tax=Bradyrhizobium sp. AZCC 1721 TaxID=3117016 RepID=UPI002FF149B9